MNWDKGVPEDSSFTIISVGTSGLFDPYVPPPAGSDTASTGNLTVQSGGKLNFVDSPFGVLVVRGTVKLSNNGLINLGGGAIILKDSATLLGGGLFRSDSGTITLEGPRWEFKSGASFDPGTSTTIFQGNVDQTLSGNVTFYNLIINTQATVTISGNVSVQGNLTVGAGATVIIPPGDTLDVRGAFVNNGSITGAYSDPLPVEMSLISASANSNGVDLRWSTATEVDNYGFEIQKSVMSGDAGGQVWFVLGFVKGVGTSNVVHYYSFSDRAPLVGLNEYRIKQINHDGTFKYANSVRLEVGLQSGSFGLHQNFPNPFNPTTNIEFSVPSDGRAVLKVYNVLGQEVATLFDGGAIAGSVQTAAFDGRHLSSGVYFTRLEFGGGALVRRMMLLK